MIPLVVVATVVALSCYWGSRVLGRKAEEVGSEAMGFRLQNQQDTIEFAHAGGIEVLQSQLGLEEHLLVARTMVDEGRHPYEQGHVVRRLFGPDFESVDEQAKAASARASQYSMYCTLCRIGAWVAGIVAFIVVIYPFFS